MKKLLAFILAIIMLCGIFPGCAAEKPAETVPEETAAEETQPETNDLTGVDLFDIFDYPGVEEIHPGSYRACSTIPVSMGFEEMWLGYQTQPDSLRIGKMGDVLVGQFSYNKSSVVWNFRAEKTDKLENRTGIEPGEDVSVHTGDPILPQAEVQTFWWSTEVAGRYAGIEIYYFPKTGNQYTLFTGKSMFGGGSGYAPGAILMDHSDWKDDICRQVAADWNNVCIEEFTVDVGGKTLTYPYRYGSSLAEWMHSEYNTDGWFMIEHMEGEGHDEAITNKLFDREEDFYAPYKHVIFGSRLPMGEWSCNDFIYPHMATDDATREPFPLVWEYDIEKDFLNDPESFEVGSVYVVQNLPMHIYGFTMYNRQYVIPPCDEGSGPSYRFSNWKVKYGANSALTLVAIGLREEDTEHLNFLMVPHYVPAPDTASEEEREAIETGYKKANGYPYGNDLEAIRAVALELPFEAVPATELPEHFQHLTVQNRIPDYGFKLVFKPDQIENFGLDVPLDVCITYDDEIAYWLYMPGFTQ